MAGGKMNNAIKAGTAKATPKKSVLMALLLIGLIAAPILAQGFGQMVVVRILAVVGLYVMLALGLNIVVGYAGLLDLGHAAFYAIGAYTGAILGAPLTQWLTTTFPDVTWLPGLSYFILLPIAAIMAGFTGILLGLPVLRLRGDYLAIVTLGFAEIVRILIVNNAFGITGGAAGLPKAGVIMPKPLGLTWLQNNAYFTAGGGSFNFTFSSNVYWYYIILILCIVTIFIVRRLDDSRLGRSWTAMREDQVAAASMGVNITAARLWAFSIGAALAGIAGITFTNFQAFVSPESFTFMESVFILSIIIIGGLGSIPGVIVGALFIQGIPEFIRGAAQAGWLQSLGITLSAEAQSAISQYRYLVFGLLMVLMMALRPQGILPSARRARELHPEDDKVLAEMDETLYDAAHDTARPSEDL